jgi:hypothetical protein
MLIYKSEKITGCLAIASERLFPSCTSCRNCLLTSDEIPFVARCVMLLSATVSGIPLFNRFASCCVKVANSWSFGFFFLVNHSRNAGGNASVREAFGAPFARSLRSARSALATSAPRAASIATGSNPSLSICINAAERSATSTTPCTISPVRRRAL